ncbi:uncharacterized protein LOC131244372 [Magnolia sinica]|uniref:uncharacterized protein LOC131244372 n=1 Tax=Magnolia sinica TaxID=86752 RepID=UPI002657FE9B|nr:uncharacterized protein LOC131244372 [Magnolia sinica]
MPSSTDDAILFLNGMLSNVCIFLALIREYESASGQRVNASKTSFLSPKKTSRSKAQRLSNLTSFCQAFLPMVYLGIPLTKGKITSPLLQPIMHKITSKIDGWKAKLLNPTAKQVLIKHVLSSMPIHLLIPINIPKLVCKSLEKAFANFSGAVLRRETMDIRSNGPKSARLSMREV